MAKTENIFGESGGGALTPTLLGHDSIAANGTATVSASSSKRYAVTATKNYTQSADETMAVAYVENGEVTQLFNSDNIYPITFSNSNISIKNGSPNYRLTYIVIQLD